MQLKAKDCKNFSDMVYKVWLPMALSVGCSYEIFWTLNPVKVGYISDGYRYRMDRELKLQRQLAYESGLYVKLAIASSFSKDVQFPDKPFGSDDAPVQNDGNTQQLTDAEKFQMFVIAHNKQKERFREQQKSNQINGENPQQKLDGQSGV